VGGGGGVENGFYVATSRWWIGKDGDHVRIGR
jgi:hypothetical protein